MVGGRQRRPDETGVDLRTERRPLGCRAVHRRGPELVEWSKYVDVDGLGSERAAAWEELEYEAIDYAFDVLGADGSGVDAGREHTGAPPP